MELHEVRYFLAVCQTRNFTRAAELSHVTQPALTRAIQKIEEEMGGLLFSRERGNTHLTELGRLLEPQFAEMLERANAAKAAAARFLRLEGASLNLGVMSTIGPQRCIGFMNGFRAAQPGVDLCVVEGAPAHLSEQLIAGEIDVAVMAQPEGFAEPLRATPLYDERFAIACAPGHPFARRCSVRLQDLHGQTYLRRSNCEYRDHLSAHVRDAGADIRQSYRGEREDWVQIMVAAGMGVCLLPEFASVQPGLALRPLVEPAIVRQICLVTVAGRRWSTPVAALIGALRTHRWAEGQFNDPAASVWQASAA